jgi:hypothetical protein
MTDGEAAEIQKRLDGVGPLPWKWEYAEVDDCPHALTDARGNILLDVGIWVNNGVMHAHLNWYNGCEEGLNAIGLIGHAPSDLAALLAERERLLSVIGHLRRAKGEAPVTAASSGRGRTRCR